MEILINKKFLDELALIPENKRTTIEQFVFVDIRKFDSPTEVPNLKKLKGHKSYYRIRFGNYRVGLCIKKDTLIFERVLHRKDIYKYYP